MDKNTGTKDAEATATTEVTEEVVEVSMETVSDLSVFVEDAFANESGKTPARGFTKNGLNSASSLAKLDILTLSTMAGCMIKAISNQATDEDESAIAALDIISGYAKDISKYAAEASVIAANFEKLQAYAATAINFGYGSEINQTDPDIDTLTNAQMAKMVIALVSAQKNAKPDADFSSWTKELAASED